LTRVSGNGTTIKEDQTQQLVLEARDEYNKPISGVTVNGSAEDGSFTDSSTKTTNSQGRAVFEYEPSDATPQEKRINFTIDSGYNPGGSHKADSPRNVTMTVEVDAVARGGGGGSNNSYSVDWLSPENDNSNAILSDCSETDCTWNVSADSDNNLRLNASAIASFERGGTTLKIEGSDIDFAVDNSTVGTVSPGSATTYANGSALTNLTAKENGTIGVYAAGGGASDVINITVENVTSDSGGGGGGGAAGSISYATGTAATTGGGDGFAFDINTGGNSVTLQNASIDTTNMPDGERDQLKNIFINGIDETPDNSNFPSDGTRRTLQSPSVNGNAITIEFGEFSKGGMNTQLIDGSYSFQSTSPSTGNYVTVTLGFADGTEKTLYFIPP
jgi:hypothetical protein